MDRTSTDLKYLKTDDSIVIPIEQWREYQTRLRDLEDLLRDMDKRHGKALSHLKAWEDAYRKMYAYLAQSMLPDYEANAVFLQKLKEMVDKAIEENERP